jgi:hypothetical protein
MVARARCGARSRSHSLHIDQILDGNRNTVQRSSDPAMRGFLLSVPGDCQRGLRIHFAPALDVPFDLLDAIEIVPESRTGDSFLAAIAVAIPRS